MKFSEDPHQHHLLRFVHSKDSSGSYAMKFSALTVAIGSQYLCPHSE